MDVYLLHKSNARTFLSKEREERAIENIVCTYEIWLTYVINERLIERQNTLSSCLDENYIIRLLLKMYLGLKTM